MNVFTTIRLQKDTKDLLDEMGKKSESYDAIILGLIEKARINEA